MNARRGQVIARIAIAAIILGGIALLPVTLPTPETNVPATSSPQTVGLLYDGATETQQFSAEGSDIHTASIFFSTSQRQNRGTALVTVAALNGDQWTTLGTKTVDEMTLQDNRFYTFVFSPPLPVAPHQPVRISVQANGDRGNAITWVTNTNWRPAGYTLLYNGQEQPGTARIHVQYAGRPGRVGAMILPLWRRSTIFLTPLWQVVLIVAIAITVGGLSLFSRSLDD